MAAITYGSHGASAEKKISKLSPRKGILARAWDAFVEARMRQALREIRMHQHLLPADFEIAGNKLGSRNEDQLPFVRGRD